MGYLMGAGDGAPDLFGRARHVDVPDPEVG